MILFKIDRNLLVCYSIMHEENQLAQETINKLYCTTICTTNERHV